jgi:succinate dehydrogenase hydrophobic anchor subunit
MFNMNFTRSEKGSNDWILEKFAKIIFLPSSLYVFFFFLISYKSVGVTFYLNLFFASAINLSAMMLFMSSGVFLAYLRFKAILLDYITCYHTIMVLKVIFIAVNTFFFTFVFLSFIYFNFIILITTP